MTQDKIKWTVSLSNGENVHEGKGQFKRINGELSPWLKLKEYIEKEELEITSISLYLDNGMRWNLPSIGKNPKFSQLEDFIRPNSYTFYRKLGMDLEKGAVQEEYCVIEANFNEYKLQVWVLDKSPYPSWSIICPQQKE